MIPLPSLWRTRSAPPGAEQIIDLSDEDEALAHDEQVAEPEADGGPRAGRRTGRFASAVGFLTLRPEVGEGLEPPQPEPETVAGEEPRAERRTRRFASAVGFLTLRPEVGESLRPPVAVAVGWAWLTGWVLLLSLALTAAIGWITGGPLWRPDTFVDALRLANLMPVASDSGPVSLLPLLPAIIVVALVVRVSGWLWRRLQEQQEGWLLPTAGVGAMSGGYLLIAALIATSPTPGATDAPLTQGWLALLGVVLTGVAVTAARNYLRPAYPRMWLLFRAAGTVLAFLLALSFLVVIVQLLANWSQFWDMSVALLGSGQEPASRFDAAALGAIQLAYLPNVVVWTAAYLVGAGFSVGADTIVSPFSVTIGTLPELPLTTLLPVAPLRWPWLPLVLVGLGSMLAGSVIRNAGLAKQMRTRLVVGLAVAVIAAIGMALLAGASNGGLGQGRLSMVGPHIGVTMAATLLVVGIGLVAWALFPTLVADVGPFVEHGRDRLRGRKLRLPRAPGRRRRGKSDEAAGEPQG